MFQELFLFPRIVVSRVSSSFVCLRAIRFLSHHWILRDLRYFARLHFIFAYQFEGNNKFSMGILLLPLPCQQTSAYNMKETMLKTKTKTDTNDNTNSSLHKLVHYSYEQCLNASVLRIISSIINESSMNNIRFLVNNIVVNTHVCDLIKLFLTSISDTLYLLRSKSWVTLIGNQANLLLFVFSYLLHAQM